VGTSPEIDRFCSGPGYLRGLPNSIGGTIIKLIYTLDYLIIGSFRPPEAENNKTFTKSLHFADDGLVTTNNRIN
jgi:hypothetical protein